MDSRVEASSYGDGVYAVHARHLNVHKDHIRETALGQALELVEAVVPIIGNKQQLAAIHRFCLAQKALPVDSHVFRKRNADSSVHDSKIVSLPAFYNN